MYNHNRVISVVGLGYVGLPVAVAFGKQKQCIGFDVNVSRLNELSKFVDKTKEVSAEELSATDILYTNEIQKLKQADFYIIAVPTPVDKVHKPDLTFLEEASKSVAQALKIGDIVVYESTVYPGVTEDVCVPILERVSGLRYKLDFKVGYSPERINPGDKERTFTKIRKIISGCDRESLDIIANVYNSVIIPGVFKAASIKVAEAAKVVENTQRDINISLMNELAIIFERMQIDTIEVLEAAATKWNFLFFKPGLVGGHCIGVDPYYLTHKAELLGYIPQVILSGRRINDNMGRFVARRAVKKLIKCGHSMNQVHAIILGFTFKEDCPDTRNSKVIDVVNELKDYNVAVEVCDPVAHSEDAIQEYGIMLTDFENLKPADLMIVAVGHSYFRNMDLRLLLKKIKPGAVIFDVKSILPKEKIDEMGYVLCRL